MSKALELIRTLIDGANEYEKKTGNKNPTVYFSKSNLLVIEKHLKALEIIKGKKVNIGLLKGTIKLVERGDTDWEYYNRMIMEDRNNSIYKLTKEEFELLKEVLE